MEKPQLTVLITTHNRLEYTKRTLGSLLVASPFNTKYVIVDNASTEEGFEKYLADMEELDTKVIHMETNQGWGTAVNEGLKHCDTEYILITNNDVEYGIGWYDTCLALYDKYPDIGILGVWKHTAHGVREDKGDMLIKDDMPAVGWLMRKDNLESIGEFPMHGPCATKGGNGEDIAYVKKAQEKGLWAVGPKEDVAIHLDGY